MKKLIAQQYILFESKMYSPEDELPTKNPVMVQAWLDAGTAIWIDDEEKKPSVKAIPRTAEPGVAGAAISSESEDGDNLVGKVPKTSARTKKSK